jgi:hypothetical protein
MVGLVSHPDGSRRWARIAFALVFLAGAAGAHAADEGPLYSHRVIAGARLSVAPVIDGRVDDPAWSDATLCETFVDPRTGVPVSAQTSFRLGYDDHGIYIAARCLDARPDEIVMRETKLDGRVHDDDYLEISLDPFHTRNRGDVFLFAVNPRGVRWSYMGGDRAGKEEWKGEWEASARVVEDGWTLEMSIPWGILTVPKADEPVTMGFNARRGHARQRIESLFSDLGVESRPEYAADWTGIELPGERFRPELLVLPFVAAGASETDDEWSETGRIGADVRYRPTAQWTTVLTVNPDFRNVQSEVEGIDFSRGERFVGDTRPFFQEGGGMFQTSSGIGSYFYSRRIEHIDVGAKAYGKLAKRTNLGVLATYDLGDQHDDLWSVHRQDYVLSLTQGTGEWGSFSATGVFKDDDVETNSILAGRARVRLTRQVHINWKIAGNSWREGAAGQDMDGTLSTFALGWGNGRFSLGTDLFYVTEDFRASNGFIEFPGRQGVGLKGGYGNEWRDSFVRSAGIGFWGNYEERLAGSDGLDGFGGVVRRSLSTISDRDDTDDFFRDRQGYSASLETRQNVSLSHSAWRGHFRERDALAADLDHAFDFGVGVTDSDRSSSYNVGFSAGDADGAPRRFVRQRVFRRWERITAQLQNSRLTHHERIQQHILSMNYDFTPSVGVGGRVILRRNETRNDNAWNWYVSLRRSGGRGVETFLIFGEPNGETFTPRIEGKVLLPL